MLTHCIAGTLFLSLLVACDGGGGSGSAGPVDETFRAQCDVQCRQEAASDGCDLSSACVDDCVAVTSGLDTLCGKCVVEGLFVFHREDNACIYDQGTITGEGGCTDICQQGSHSPRETFRAECEVQCRQEAASDGCDSSSACVDDCVAVTSGLDTLCGKCVVEGLFVFHREDNACIYEQGTVGGEGGCTDICQQGS